MQGTCPRCGYVEHGLTPRQVQVLLLIAEGRSNKEIARQLGITVGAVKNRASALYRSVGLPAWEASRTKAVLQAIKLGYLNLADIPESR